MSYLKPLIAKAKVHWMCVKLSLGELLANRKMYKIELSANISLNTNYKSFIDKNYKYIWKDYPVSHNFAYFVRSIQWSKYIPKVYHHYHWA